jgi:hypothetical protein
MTNFPSNQNIQDPFEKHAHSNDSLKQIVTRTNLFVRCLVVAAFPQRQ